MRRRRREKKRERGQEGERAEEGERGGVEGGEEGEGGRRGAEERGGRRRGQGRRDAKLGCRDTRKFWLAGCRESRRVWWCRVRLVVVLRRYSPDGTPSATSANCLSARAVPAGFTRMRPMRKGHRELKNILTTTDVEFLEWTKKTRSGRASSLRVGTWTYCSGCAPGARRNAHEYNDVCSCALPRWCARGTAQCLGPPGAPRPHRDPCFLV